jgi:hypothetical protein
VTGKRTNGGARRNERTLARGSVAPCCAHEPRARTTEVTSHYHCVVAIRRTFVAILTVFCVAAVGAQHASAGTGSGCRVPRLRGLTLSAARTLAARTRCRLRVKGATLVNARIQTVRRQSPGARTRSASVIVWLGSVPASAGEDSGAGQPAEGTPPVENPSALPPPLRPCPEGWAVAGSQVYDEELEGPFGNPHLTPGPTEFVSGFFMDGGPPPPEGCERPPTPSGGTVEVKNDDGEVIATQTSEYEHLVEIPLGPGTYTITSTFVSATFCMVKTEGGEECMHPQETFTVTIPPGYTVRKDFTIGIP